MLFRSKRWVKRISEKGKTYAMAQLFAEVADNPSNPVETTGRKVYHTISTLVFEHSGTTSAQALIQGFGFGEQLKVMPRTHQTQIRLVNDLISQEKLVAGETDWSIRRYDKAKDEVTFTLVGESRFPKDADGRPVPTVNVDGEDLMARNFIRSWKTLDSLQGQGQSQEQDAIDNSEQTQQPAEPQEAQVPAATAATAASASASAATASRPVPTVKMQQHSTARPPIRPRPIATTTTK